MSVAISSVLTMSTATITEPSSSLITRLSDADAERIAQAVEDSLSENTRRAYRSAMRRYQAWISVSGYEATMWTPEVVSAYIAALADASPSTVEIARAAILHHAARHDASTATLLRDHPGVRATVRGVRRQQRGWTPTRARAFSRAEIRAMADTCDVRTPQGIRDRAVLLVMVSLGLRASDMASLRWSGVSAVDGGLDIEVPYSKTDATAVTLALPRIGGPLCAVTALEAWQRVITALDEEPNRGRVLRPIRRGGWSVGGPDAECSTEVVSTIIHRLSEAAGLAQDRGRVSTHSCRATMATLALDAGVPESQVAITGRWKSLQVLRRYDRRTRWSDPAGGWLGR